VKTVVQHFKFFIANLDTNGLTNDDKHKLMRITQ